MEDFGVAMFFGLRQPVLHFMLSMLSQFMKLEIRIIENRDDALATLARLDPSLSHLAD